MIVGPNLGLGEITTPEDITDAAAAGATGVRIVPRWLGIYGEVFQQDSRDDDAPHNIRPDYVAMLTAMRDTARACGMSIVMGMDSDQLQGRLGGMDLWTPDGRKAREQFIRVARYLTRQLEPDYIEPIVEPQGPNVTQEGLWAYQEQHMSRTWEVRPSVKGLIGGAPSYLPAYVDKVFRPEWASPSSPFFGRVAITVNFADEICRNDRMFSDRLRRLLAERDLWGVEVIVNQIWTDADKDPDGAWLAKRIRQLAQEGIGSLVWTACTRFREGPGMAYLADPNDPRSAHVKHEARWRALAEVWGAFA